MHEIEIGECGIGIGEMECGRKPVLIHGQSMLPHPTDQNKMNNVQHCREGAAVKAQFKGAQGGNGWLV